MSVNEEIKNLMLIIAGQKNIIAGQKKLSLNKKETARLLRKNIWICLLGIKKCLMPLYISLKHMRENAHNQQEKKRKRGLDDFKQINNRKPKTNKQFFISQGIDEFYLLIDTPCSCFCFASPTRLRGIFNSFTLKNCP